MPASRSAPRRPGARRVARVAGLTTIAALLIVLMAGTEVFRPLRDLRSVLHQGMAGQSAAAGINALLAAEPLVPPRGAGHAASAADTGHRTGRRP